MAEYKHLVRKGDRVITPYGYTGTVKFAGYEFNSIESMVVVIVRPHANWISRFFLMLFGRTSFVDTDINLLQKIG